MLRRGGNYYAAAHSIAAVRHGRQNINGLTHGRKDNHSALFRAASEIGSEDRKSFGNQIPGGASVTIP